MIFVKVLRNDSGTHAFKYSPTGYDLGQSTTTCMYFNKKNINRTTPQVPSKDAAFERRTHTHTPPLCRLGLPHWTLG